MPGNDTSTMAGLHLPTTNSTLLSSPVLDPSLDGGVLTVPPLCAPLPLLATTASLGLSGDSDAAFWN